jgi:hypothetical protein
LEHLLEPLGLLDIFFAVFVETERLLRQHRCVNTAVDRRYFFHLIALAFIVITAHRGVPRFSGIIFCMA